MTIKEQTMEMRLQKQQDKNRIKEERLLSSLKEQEEQREYVKNYILSNYEISRNFKDKINSSYINEKINSTSPFFINTIKVKNILLNIDGVSHSKTKGYMIYRGLKEKEN